MDNSSKLQWIAAFAAASRALAVPEETIDKVSEHMWSSAGLLDPEQAASEYVSMLVSAGMQERRRTWRGWPARDAGGQPGDVEGPARSHAGSAEPPRSPTSGEEPGRSPLDGKDPVAPS